MSTDDIMYTHINLRRHPDDGLGMPSSPEELAEWAKARVARDAAFRRYAAATPTAAAEKAPRPEDDTDVVNGTGGVKYDGDKARMDLLPMDAMYAISCVFTYGAIKYDDWNWAKGMRKGRLIAAALRHVTAYMMGEELDDESGLPHTWHLGCCVLMLISCDLRGIAGEDRSTNLAALGAARHAFSKMKPPPAK